MKRIMQESYVDMYIDDNNILHADWKGFLKLEKLKPAVDVMMDHIAKNKVTKHVSNHRQLQVLSNDVRAFLENEWFPRAEKAGINKMAAIISDNIFAEMSAKQVTEKAVKKSIETKYFVSSEDGAKWLNS